MGGAGGADASMSDSLTSLDSLIMSAATGGASCFLVDFFLPLEHEPHLDTMKICNCGYPPELTVNRKYFLVFHCLLVAEPYQHSGSPVAWKMFVCCVTSCFAVRAQETASSRTRPTRCGASARTRSAAQSRRSGAAAAKSSVSVRHEYIQHVHSVTVDLTDAGRSTLRTRRVFIPQERFGQSWASAPRPFPFPEQL